MPWSIVSGVRSSCEAVATNERRACSWRAQLLLHAPERAREVADLVAALVVLQRRVGDALLGDPQRGRAQPPEPAQQRARQRDGERDRHQQADRARGQQRVAHLVDRGRDLGQAALDDEHADRRRPCRRTAARRSARRRPGRSVVVVCVRGVRSATQRRRRGSRRPCSCRRAKSPASTEVVDQHAPVGALAQLLGHAAGRANASSAARAAPPRSPGGGEHGRAQVRRALLAQPVGQRAQQDGGRDAERDRAREQQRQQQAGPQAARQPPPQPHRSRTR